MAGAAGSRAVPILLLALTLAACGEAAVGATTTLDRIDVAAREYGASAQRALGATAYDSLTPIELGDVIAAICRSSGQLAADVESAIAALGSSPGPGDVEVVAEVLITGVDQVCPERSAGEVALFLGAVMTTVESQGGVEISRAEALAAGTASCNALAVASPGDALAVIVAGLFGVEATVDDIIDGAAITLSQGVTAGAVLASAVSYLCPAHRAAVDDFLAGL
jgi:hypothetical protein